MLASLTEAFLLNSGLSVTPMDGQADGQGSPPNSLRDLVSQIDNDKDLRMYVMSFAPKVPSRRSEIKYERHPV